MSIRVLIVDGGDEPGDGSLRLLNKDADLEIIGAAHNGEDAVRLANELRADAVLVPLATESLNSNSLTLDPDSADLIGDDGRRIEQFRLIANIGRRITSILTVDELLSEAPKLIQQTFGFYHVHIGLTEGAVITFKARHGVWQDLAECQICVPDRPRIDGSTSSVCSWVAQNHRPALIPDVNNSAIYQLWHAGQRGSSVVMPIEVQGEFIGLLEVENERVSAFDDTDVVVLQSLSDQLAVAIANARLYERAQQLAALEERQKLARELHDSVSQAIYGIALGARTARAHLERNPEKVGEPLDYVMSLAKAAQIELRALVFELRPESLEQEGIVAALTKQAEALAARYSIDVNSNFCIEPAAPLEVKQALYRVAQEALHNIVKHSKATEVDLKLNCDENLVILEIHDNGVGFDPEGAFPGHLGLRSMRERVAQQGGRCTIESSPNSGTKLLAQVPLQNAA